MAVETHPTVPPSPLIATYSRRALALWPRLDRTKLRRAAEDPSRIARLVESRTALSRDQILSLLGVPRSIDRG